MCGFENFGAIYQVPLLSETWIFEDLERVENPVFLANHSVHTRTAGEQVTVLVDSELGRTIYTDLLDNRVLYFV